jgi:hypothetical protein
MFDKETIIATLQAVGTIMILFTALAGVMTLHALSIAGHL